MNAPDALPVPPDGLQRLMAMVDAAPSLRTAVRTVAALLPSLRVLPMDAADLHGETPAVRGTWRALYLAESDGHCWRMTDDPARAAAVVVTEHTTRPAG